MKKETFLDLVCGRFYELDLSESDIEKQRRYINKYLSDMGIEEESEELDEEDPIGFADDIYELMRSRGLITVRGRDEDEHVPEVAEAPQQPEMPEEPFSEPPTPPEQPVEQVAEPYEEPLSEPTPVYEPETNASGQAENDVSFYDGDFTRTNISLELPTVDVDASVTDENTATAAFTIPSDDADELPYTDEELERFYEEEGLSDENLGEFASEVSGSPNEDGDTIKFDISAVELERIRKASAKAQARGNDDDEDDYYVETFPETVGNPVLFYLLAVILSPIWLSLFAVLLAVVGVVYVVLALFKLLYIPMIVAVLVCGSVASVAELFHGVFRVVGGSVYIGLFEAGLGLILAAVTILLVVLIYKAGTGAAPILFKKFGKFIKKRRKKLKTAIMKLKGACCI